MKLKSFMHIITGLSGILLLAMCQDSPFFHRFAKVDRDGWHSDSAAVFELPVYQKDCHANVDVWIRSTAEYTSESLTLVATAECGGNMVWRDTLSIHLYDDKGKCTGTGFPFTEYHIEAKALEIKADTNYTIRIRHIMRDNPVRGITACGIRLSE
ncbi:MAG: gliding motility lipoprotein GldH [Bacteroides sp.]|nr:gliding motility lipoprotein GldH [Roseburia sp.]MCM1346383.1 gliding motility lipoprotein GldH [Bacteroides sp.]MCM1420118.1 gliding motility lipoprotein GldH [Bacteroides sp.]